MTLTRLLIAVLLLFLGRQLYWLFVGGVGFLTAITVVSQLGLNVPHWLLLVIAIAAGIIGVFLAFFLQKFAVVLGGFLAGGVIVTGFLEMMGLQTSILTGIIAIAGAIIGLILALALFDWALIILSSLSGAVLLAQSVRVPIPLQLLIFGVLLAIGIVFQFLTMQRQAEPPSLTER